MVFQPANKWFNLPTWVIAVEFVCSFKTRGRFLNNHAKCIVRVSSIFKSLLFAVRTSAVAPASKELSNNDHFHPLLFAIIIFNMKSSHFLLSKINKLDRDFLHGQIFSLVFPLRNHITLILSHHCLKRVQRFEKITGFVNNVYLHDAGIFSPSAMVIGFRSHLVVAWFVSPGL